MCVKQSTSVKIWFEVRCECYGCWNFALCMNTIWIYWWVDVCRWLVYNINGFIDFCWLVIQLHGHLFSLCWNWTFWSKMYGLNVRNLDINHWKVIECYSWLCCKSEGFGIQSLDAFEHRVRTVWMRSWWFELRFLLYSCMLGFRSLRTHVDMCDISPQWWQKAT